MKGWWMNSSALKHKVLLSELKKKTPPQMDEALWCKGIRRYWVGPTGGIEDQYYCANKF